MSMQPRPTAAEIAFAKGLGKPIELRGDEPCIGHVDIFFPDRTNRPQTEAALATAKRLCAGCDRAFECRSKARIRKEQDGVWGGEDFYRRNVSATKTERQSRRQPIKHGTVAGYSAHMRRGEDPCDDCKAAHKARKDRYKQPAQTVAGGA